MQIDLPDDVTLRLRHWAATSPGLTEIDVIRKGLDALDWQSQERLAVEEGVEAMRRGDIEDFDEFDRELRETHRIASRR